MQNIVVKQNEQWLHVSVNCEQNIEQTNCCRRHTVCFELYNVHML